MTFIASVVAKRGVAVIADSLVTFELPILHYQKFIDYLDTQPNNAEGDKLINPDNIRSLFNSEPTFTKDFEEKLFELNKQTAITTTGEAYINGQNIADIIEEYVLPKEAYLNGSDNSIEEKIQDFITYINGKIKGHLQTFPFMGYLVFMITHYIPTEHKTKIWKAIINPVDASTLQEEDYDYVNLTLQQDWAKVVCDGQNKLSERVLYGLGKEMFEIFPTFVNNIINKLNVEPNTIPENFVEQLRADEYFDRLFYSDVALFNLNNLSLQQAVDLACLLMRLEVDFQKYTKDVPTVGGFIKLAVIDEKGFHLLQGDKIEVPKHINY